MRAILISVLMLFALQSKASVIDTLTSNSLTEVRINDVVYIGHVHIVDNTIYVSPVNTIKVERNNSTVVYVDGKATTLKYVVAEPLIKVDYNIVKLNK